jgi:glycosyltransferase involved in cell wall biosynthesis
LTPGLTVFIPVYNEEPILRKNVLMLLDYLKRFGISHEVIIGSNGSTDATERIGAELVQENPNKVVFFHVPPRGPGLAFAEALKRARYEYFLGIDADLSLDMPYIDDALAKLPH